MDPSSSVLVIIAASFASFIFGWFVASVGPKAYRSSGAPSGLGGASGGIRLQDIRRLESKIDLLLQHLNLAPPADVTVNQIARQHDVPPEVLALLPNRKIDAIKLMREMTGLGLKEAKDKVDAACSEMRR